MCEWTPPLRDEAEQVDVAAARTRALERRDERRVLEERAVANRLVHAHQVLEEDPAGADRQVPTSELPICPSGRPTASPDAFSVVCGYSRQSRSNTGRRRELDGVARPGRRAAPAVEDDERYEVEAARQIAAKESGSSEAPPTSAPSIDGCERSSAAFSGLTEPP